MEKNLLSVGHIGEQSDTKEAEQSMWLKHTQNPALRLLKTGFRRILLSKRNNAQAKEFGVWRAVQIQSKIFAKP